jgi:hypothetical protein
VLFSGLIKDIIGADKSANSPKTPKIPKEVMFAYTLLVPVFTPDSLKNPVSVQFCAASDFHILRLFSDKFKEETSASVYPIFTNKGLTLETLKYFSI